MQQTLFGVTIPEKEEYTPQRQKIIEKHLDKVEKHNLKIEVRAKQLKGESVSQLIEKKVKARKPVRRKGIITISLCEYDDNSEENLKNWREKNIPIPKINGFAVDFTGHNEGSGSPCKDEIAVMKQVENLRAKHEKEYKLEIRDKRVSQSKIRELVKGKKIIVEVKYGLDSKDERDFFVSDNRREMGIESCLGGAGSSAYKRFEKLEDGEKEAVKWIIKDVMEDGIPRENIEVVRVEMNEEDLRKHNEWKADRRKSDLEYAEKDIKNYSEKLKKALEVKYGYKVKIEVKRDEEKDTLL